MGEKKGYRYPYLREISYDKFEQRLQVEYGNGVKSTYTYAPDTRRLATLTAGKNGVQRFQNLNYTYDRVGNVVRLANTAEVPARNDFGGPVTQGFSYDSLYRLTNANGTFTGAQGSEEYILALTYDSIHNIQRKDQDHNILGSQPKVATKTTYDWEYGYPSPGQPRPHAPSRIGARLYSYDLNGNQLGWQSELNNTSRTMVWDEENRLKQLKEGQHTHDYVYDDQGSRTIKLTSGGEIAYVNQWYTVRNGAAATKHVFAGTTRLADKLVLQGALNPGNTVQPIEKDLYYYHPDHLGSTGYVTDRRGQLTEHVQYFPFGESWVEQRQGADRTPYLFTGKELDEETGLYYFGARYYDPRTSVWQSGDPAFERYLPGSETVNLLLPAIEDPLVRPDLPGGGGVFHGVNLNSYVYGGANPIRYNDPTGKILPIRDPYDTPEWEGCPTCKDARVEAMRTITKVQNVGVGVAAAGPLVAAAAVEAAPTAATAIATRAAPLSAKASAVAAELYGKALTAAIATRVAVDIKVAQATAAFGNFVNRVGASAKDMLGRVLSSPVATNPDVQQKALDFTTSAVNPGPPEASPAGYIGGFIGPVLSPEETLR